jgi:hypothetical protein
MNFLGVISMKGWVVLIIALVLMLSRSVPAAHAYLQLPGNEVKLVVHAMPGSIEITGIPASFFVANGFNLASPANSGFPLTAGADVGYGGPGWCADRHTTITAGTVYTAQLYSSYDPNLPACARDGKDWPRINYLFHIPLVSLPESLRRPTTDAEMQEAIWYFSENGTDRPLPSSATAQGLVREALKNGAGYRPSDKRDELIVAFVSCEVQPVFFQLHDAGVVVPPVVQPPTVPPPVINVPAPPTVPPPTIITPTPTPVSVPAIPVSVAAGAAVGAAALGAGLAIDTRRHEEEKESEEEEPQREPLSPIPAQ